MNVQNAKATFNLKIYKRKSCNDDPEEHGFASPVDACQHHQHT